MENRRKRRPRERTGSARFAVERLVEFEVAARVGLAGDASEAGDSDLGRPDDPRTVAARSGSTRRMVMALVVWSWLVFWSNTVPCHVASAG
jgi:hypothetical protein